MPDYVALRAALADYPGKSDGEIAAALTAPLSVNVDTPINDALGVLMSNGEWPAIVLRAEERPATPITKAAMQAVALAKMASGGGMTVIQTGDTTAAAAFDAALGGLQAVGDISQASVSTIRSMRVQTTTRAAQMGFGPGADMAQEIAAARRIG